MESGKAVVRNDGGNCIKFTSSFALLWFQRYTRNKVNKTEERKNPENFYFSIIYILKLCMHKRYKVIIFQQTLFNAPSSDPICIQKYKNIYCYYLLM